MSWPCSRLGWGLELVCKLCTWKCFLQKKMGLVWICLFHLYGCSLSCIGITGVRRGQKTSGPLELEFTDACEPPWGCWKLNPVLRKSPVQLTSEPCPQPLTMNGYSLDVNCPPPHTHKGWEVEHLLAAGSLSWGAHENQEVRPGWRKQVTGSTFLGLCISPYKECLFLKSLVLDILSE